MIKTDRREFLKTAGGAAVGLFAVSGLAAGVISCADKIAAAPSPSASPSQSPSSSPSPVALTFPWPFQKIDAVTAAERAYTAYYNGGCMFGGFEGIIGELREKVGNPYTGFPTTMMKYGGGGVSGWGTLCGALNGVAAAIYLVADTKANPIINEVFNWYGVTALPDYKPAKPKYPDIPASVANSQLCHVSVSTWCDKSKFKATSPERAERCAWLTASVVKYAVALLNQQADGTFKATYAVPASVTGCLSCHGKSGMNENVHTSNQTDCSSCHTLGASHPPVAK